MSLFYRVTDKELLKDRNEIFANYIAPQLNNNGFEKSPFSTSWFGKNNLGDYTYELCRLQNSKLLEIVTIEISRGDKWIKIYLNIFNLGNPIKSLKEIKGVNGLKLQLPPNSLSKMRLRIDDYKGIPLFRTKEHKIKTYYTRGGYEKSKLILSKLLSEDMNNIKVFIENWNNIHTPQNIILDNNTVE